MDQTVPSPDAQENVSDGAVTNPGLRQALDVAAAAKLAREQKSARRSARSSAKRRAGSLKPSKWDNPSWLLRASVFEGFIAVLAGTATEADSSVILFIVCVLATILSLTCLIRRRSLIRPVAKDQPQS
jgi:hypothetical protein